LRFPLSEKISKPIRTTIQESSMHRVVAFALLSFIGQLLFMSPNVLASGVGDVTIRLNGGANVAYTGGVENTLEILIKNDVALRTMEIDFSIVSAVPLTWTKPYGTYPSGTPVLAVHGDAVGKISSLYFIVNDYLNNTSPDSIQIAASSLFASDDLPPHLSSTLCYSLKFKILSSNSFFSNGICIDNIVFPGGSSSWGFIQGTPNLFYAPTFQGQANASTSNPSAPPVCFNILGSPAVATAAVSAITQTTAQCGGTIFADGGSAVTARGVCWSTNPTPTVADSKTTNGTGTGSFASSITGLTPNTSYYVRAYATNSTATGYGSAVLFSTLSPQNGDVNCDGSVNISDAIYLIAWIFSGGQAPCGN
jgi:hypothetical protein